VAASAVDAAWERFARGAAGRHREVPAERLPRRRPAALLLAATVAAAALGVTLLRLEMAPQGKSAFGGPGKPTPVAPVQDPLQEQQRGSAEAEEHWEPEGDLRQAPAEFRFPVAGDEAVRVTLFDEHGYRWTSPPATGGRLALPPEERQKLRPGVDYYWTLRGGGSAVGGEAARHFRILPAPPHH
jgi:hypothetical protein